MDSSRLASELVSELKKSGASMVGFGDLTLAPREGRHGLPVGISIAVALDPQITASIVEGPTKPYGDEYDRVNKLLDKLAEKAADFLKSRGHNAVAYPATLTDFDRATLTTAFPHKTAATSAGLGWIGKCALLITKDFGSAVRLATVFTDADLPTSKPIDESKCGDCTRCVDVCPGLAPSGGSWNSAASRSDFYDAFACCRKAIELSRSRGIEHVVCGICIAACPWTRKYLAPSGF